MEPSEAHTLRDPDKIFVESLKKEMMANPMSHVSPIIGLVKLQPGEKFDSKHPHSYKYETIGGNNSRIALQVNSLIVCNFLQRVTILFM